MLTLERRFPQGGRYTYESHHRDATKILNKIQQAFKEYHGVSILEAQEWAEDFVDLVSIRSDWTAINKETNLEDELTLPDKYKRALHWFFVLLTTKD